MQKIKDLSIFGFGFHGNTFILVGKNIPWLLNQLLEEPEAKISINYVVKL